MKKFFITATGTGIGKTLITTALCRQLKSSGKEVVALKPVISGYEPSDAESDTALILNSLDLPVTDEHIEKISPWRLTAPLSPNLAAKKEGKHISVEELVAFCKKQRTMMANDDILLVEAVGGVCTPLNDKYTVLDWITQLPDWKIILVAGSYLGSISHTLTAFQSIEARGLALHAVVVSESENNNVAIEDTVETLKKFLPESVVIISVPRQRKYDKYSGILSDISLRAIL